MKTTTQPHRQLLKKCATQASMLLVAALFLFTAVNAQNDRGGRRGNSGGGQPRPGAGAGGQQQARPQVSPGGNQNRQPSVRPGNNGGGNTRPGNAGIGNTRPAPTRQTTIVNINNRPGNTVNRQPINNRPGGNTNYRRPSYDARNPSWRYANAPRRNTVINVMPATYRSINYGGFNYRYNNGSYYRPYNNGWMVVAAPIGIFLDIMPFGYRQIYVGQHPYYYYNGGYYDYRNNGYYVVSPPLGAIVPSIPAGYETVTIDGETYYIADGAQYKPVVQDNGEIWYQVIKES